MVVFPERADWSRETGTLRPDGTLLLHNLKAAAMYEIEIGALGGSPLAVSTTPFVAFPRHSDDLPEGQRPNQACLWVKLPSEVLESIRPAGPETAWVYLRRRSDSRRIR